MTKYNYVYICLIAVMLTTITLIIAIVNQITTYTEEREQLISYMEEGTIDNYFSLQEEKVGYNIDNIPYDVYVRQLCVECNKTIATNHNTGTLLIDSGPDEVCDIDVERCVLYSYDPFGFEKLQQTEMIRTQKTDIEGEEK